MHKIKNINEYIMVFLLIFVSVTPLLSINGTVTILFILLVFNIKYIKVIKLNRKTFVLIMFSFLFSITASLDLLNVTNRYSYSILNLYFLMCFIIGYLVSIRFDLDSYLYYMEKIVFISALFSLVGMFILYYSPSTIANLPYYTYGGFTHKTGYLFNILFADGNLVIRNTGFAREPGVYQMLLNFGVTETINSKSNNKILKLIIYGLAIFLTKSTAGLVIYAVLLLKMLNDVPESRFLFGASFIIFANELSRELNYQTTYKLIGSETFYGRLQKTINAFNLGRTYLFGIGNTGYDSNYLSYNIGAWDSYGQIFIRYGYFMLLAYLYLLFKLAQKNLGIFLIIALTSLSQGIWFNVFLTPIYFMAFDVKD